MTEAEYIRQKSLVTAALALLGLVLFVSTLALIYRPVHAQNNREVAPYKFADLPYGRIYKSVHEGCELFIVESDFFTDYHNLTEQHAYSVTLGRCQ